LKISILGTRGYPSTYGGFETLVRHLAPYLESHGHSVTVFDRTLDRRASVLDDGVRVVRSRGLSGTASSTLTHGLSSTLMTARDRPDVALIMNVANGFFLPGLRVRGVPTVLNVDGVEWEREKWSPTGRRVFHAGAVCTARWADALISDSRAIAARWEKEFHRTSYFIPYGGDADEASPHHVIDLGLRPGGYALVVARLVPENNVLLMLEAAKASAPEVVVVGSGASSAENDRIARHASDPRVRLLGHVADQSLLNSLWAHCGVYLHGHSVGGTNPALVQAMGLGAPVLALDTPYNREVLVDERMLVPRNGDAISGRVTEVLDSRAESQAMVDAARKRVNDVYNWTMVCAAYESALSDTVAGAGA
jgi:glycosyltransferase involved in cell wall biosynthesis